MTLKAQAKKGNIDKLEQHKNVKLFGTSKNIIIKKMQRDNLQKAETYLEVMYQSLMSEQSEFPQLVTKDNPI